MATGKKKSGNLRRGMSDEISYEDILVAQYMDHLQKKDSKMEGSPFDSPYAPPHPHPRKPKRPASAVVHNRKNNNRLGSETSSHHNVPVAWNDGSTVASTQDLVVTRSHRRPTSAPVRRKRSSSFTSATSLTSHGTKTSYASGSFFSASTMRRKKPIHKKTPPTLCVRAFQNGTRDNYARVAAPDLGQLLELCTDKLGLVNAGRRIFLADGTNVTHACQLEKDCDVYISSGESFQDPYAKIRDREELRRSSSWTVNGIILPEDKKRGKTKVSLSKRMKQLVDSQKRRVLVFKNGDCAEGVEIVAGRFDEFLDDCTMKLNLESGARYLYDWEGKEVESFADVPVLDRILQPSTTVILGPLWVARGAERFSPKGAKNFLTTLICNTKDRKNQALEYQNQIESQLHGGDTLSKEIHSMTKEQAEKELEEVQNHIMELDEVIPKLQGQLKSIKAASHEEQQKESTGEPYKLQHISEIQPNHRLLGKQGLRLKIYENGKIDGEVIMHFNLREAEKGIEDQSQLMHRFLDTCSFSSRLGGGGQMVKRLFLEDGTEITDVDQIENEQEIWLSYGEDFKPLHIFVLQLTVDKARGISLWKEKLIIQRESLVPDDERGKERPILWRATQGFPSNAKLEEFDQEMLPVDRVNYAASLQHSQVQESSSFLQFKDNPSLVLYPEVVVEKKRKRDDKDMWPPDCQQWVIHKNGLIQSKAMPQLVLSSTHQAVTVQYSSQETAQGFAVSMLKKCAHDVDQQWGFSPTGEVYSLSKPSMVLTFVGHYQVSPVKEEAVNHEESHQFMFAESLDNGLNGGLENGSNGHENETKMADLSKMEDVFGGCTFNVVLAPKLPAKHPARATQRWAVKQEDVNNMGQWKNSTVRNPEWNKRCLSWPVTEQGTWNEDFEWPMEGFLLPHAPPLKKASDKNSQMTGPPARVIVLKNGETDTSRAATVVGPDLTNMMRDVNNHSPTRTKSKKRYSGGENGESRPTLDIRQIELNLFLDRCTEALGLPFAARRIFDEAGKEILNLGELKRNQTVHVSCGEGWIDPKLTYAEQQRRLILANLASDIVHIRQFCMLRDPKDLVLCVDGAIGIGSRVCVGSCELTPEERDQLVIDKTDKTVDTTENEESIEQVRNGLLSAHDRAHVKAEERLKSLKWPWENSLTSRGDSIDFSNNDVDANNEMFYTDDAMHKKFRRNVALKNQESKPLYSNQLWSFSEGFIHLKGNPQFVLGLDSSSTEGKSANEVIICKKKLEDANQRWVIAEDGSIFLRHNPQLILSVSTPHLKTDPFSDDSSSSQGYLGCPVILAHRKACSYGNAHQLWNFDSITGFIDGFFTDSENQEITAANKANVCTYAVTGPQQIYQMGYVMSLKDSDKVYLCDACGKAVRGKHKTHKLNQLKKFSCVMGQAKNYGLKISGCFKCLNSKVDLSSLEAEATLSMWEQQLNRLRRESSVRTIAHELHMAQTVSAVRIRAFKNGEGSRGEGVIVIGASIVALLDQCTLRLGLASAARRLYTIDGELITDVNQLMYKPFLPEHTRTDAEFSKQFSVKVKIDDFDESQERNAVNAVENENRNMFKTNEESQKPSKVQKNGLDSGFVGMASGSKDLSQEEMDDSMQWDSRCPIDVWVSGGEAFIPLEDADRQYIITLKQREERTWVAANLEREKHVLRQMQGRRISGHESPLQVTSALTPTWTEPTRAEERKQETINELQNHLNEVKTRQKHEHKAAVTKSSKASAKRLYALPKTIRVYVYLNGETSDRATAVFGSTVQEILDHCISRLNMSSAARRLFTTEGKEITDIEEIERDQILCASAGENFTRARDRRHQVELKATWSRLNRQYGGGVQQNPITPQKRIASEPMLALPAPSSPPPVKTSPSRQVSFHKVSASSRR